ncbi:hypothetical protein [Corynebacterium sp. HMSC05E07]|uniref:hypothetical protein n=1 Tax=Corynebacterium sp. HMSC05E07 TaxID=1581117 RepID=UPI0008A2E21E|nr:hypothetical protein [Corynebacterium sp. HMSC05E07]OFT58584.1 hypothetical protein HMPREF3149_10855 [Corynebacterium sp. HMSC05E07]
MSLDKRDVHEMLEDIEINDNSVETSQNLQISLRKDLASSLGEVLWGIAVSSSYKWSCYRDRSVVDLLTALGIAVEGRPTLKAVRPMPDYLDPSLEELRRRDRKRERREVHKEFWSS